MGQPWGISGPQFLGLYLAGMAATLAVACLARSICGSRTQIMERARKRAAVQA
jgi:hypothetical protein